MLSKRGDAAMGSLSPRQTFLMSAVCTPIDRKEKKKLRGTSFSKTTVSLAGLSWMKT